MKMRIEETKLAEIVDHIREGRKFDAIKALRQGVTGQTLGLKEAKYAIEAAWGKDNSQATVMGLERAIWEYTSCLIQKNTITDDELLMEIKRVIENAPIDMYNNPLLAIKEYCTRALRASDEDYSKYSQIVGARINIVDCL